MTERRSELRVRLQEQVALMERVAMQMLDPTLKSLRRGFSARPMHRLQGHPPVSAQGPQGAPELFAGAVSTGARSRN